MPESATPDTLIVPAQSELVAEARRAVDLAREAGADDAFACVSWHRGVEHAWRDETLESAQESASRGLSIQLHVDGRYSAQTTNDLAPARLAAFLRDAVAMTRCLEADPHRRMPDPALYEGRSDADLDLVDEAVGTIDREERLELCRTMADAARAHEDVISTTASVASSQRVLGRVSSNGFEGSESATALWAAASVTLREGETRRPEDHWHAGGTHREDLPSAASIGEEALARALARRGSKKAPSRRTAMILEPRAAGGFLGRILGAMTAAAIQQKRSFLAEAKGRRIGSDVLSLRDDPLLVRGLGSRHFDSEGIAARPRALVDEGTLRDHYVDTYYGRKLGWAPTTGSPSNVVLGPGEGDVETILADVGEAILVTSWLGGNADGTTGDFSFGLRGHVIRDGRRAEPIGEMNVTGSYGELLPRLVRAGDDALPWTTMRVPTLVFEDVEFSGA